MEFWQRASNERAHRDRQIGRALGFDQCVCCDQWFHHGAEDWVDCAGCGRYCPECAEGVEWFWCDGCGLHYCPNCSNAGDEFTCGMCQYGTWDQLDR